MVSRDYLLRKPAPPSRAKVAFDQQVIPAAVDAAASAEAALERWSRLVARAPFAAIGAVLGLGIVLGMLGTAARSSGRRR
jgi:anti-sigma factor RsiW